MFSLPFARQTGAHNPPTASGPLAERFARDKRGNVAIIFALCSFVTVSLVGGAIDFGRVISFRGQLQQALDAAALAAGSHYAMDANHNVEAALNQAKNYFTAQIEGKHGATLTSALDESTNTVTLTADADVPTPFLALTGINSIQLAIASVVSTTQTISNGENTIELALMLDVTGSMGDPVGPKDSTIKIKGLQSAAKNLIDILMPAGKSQSHTRISVVPFSNYVNLGDYVVGFTGEPLEKQFQTGTVNCNPVETCSNVCTNWSGKGKSKTCTQYENQCTTSYSQCPVYETRYQRRCLYERNGTDAYKDTAPVTGFSARWTTSKSSAVNCGPGSATTIVPMTTNGSALKTMIDSFNPTGTTAGQLGTAYAWYTLSPNFSSVFSGASAPKAYGTAKHKKIAVLMTDGLYNTNYNSINGDGSAAQAKNMCAAMRTAGIEIYTVGFGFDAMSETDRAAAKGILDSCATDASHAFYADTVAQLTDSFREIAYRSVPLHVRQ